MTVAGARGRPTMVIAMMTAAILGLRRQLPAKAATSTIQIVFSVGVDLLRTGLVPSLGEPSGNVTRQPVPGFTST